LAEADNVSLETLVERARNSDPDAWEALYAGAYTALHAFARRRLVGHELAEDAVSETFERAYRRIQGFRWRDGGFNAWLYGILRNVTREMARKSAREVRSERIFTIEDPSEEPVYALLQDEEAVAVRLAFSQLRPDEQELLEMRVLGRLDADEVGRLVGKRAGAVRMAQSRAIERLRVLMQEAARV
jgi:RNA polymerase sigma-70 factor, ECF subfamily